MTKTPRFLIFLPLIFIGLLCACASTQKPVTAGSVQVKDTILSKAVTHRGKVSIPVNPTSVFFTTDKEVCALIRMENLSGEHVLQWKWYAPGGELYSKTSDYQIKTRPNTFAKEGGACHRIAIRDTEVALRPGEWRVNTYLDNALVATDVFEIVEVKQGSASLPETDEIPNINFGDYYALVIGINTYKELPPLVTAVHDAQEVSGILEESYGYKVNTLLNATRSDILLALGNYRKTLKSKDNLLIYFAGHGWLDQEADEGYWIPMDANIDNKLNWISNSDITSYIRATHAKHILVVADSCYSGKLTRSVNIPIRSSEYYERICSKRGRSVLCSGGLEPVSDSGGKGGHSVFASAFINVLKNNKGIIDGTQLFMEIRHPVILNSDQTPQYSDIRKAGHDGGEFLFVRRR